MPTTHSPNSTADKQSSNTEFGKKRRRLEQNQQDNDNNEKTFNPALTTESPCRRNQQENQDTSIPLGLERSKQNLINSNECINQNRFQNTDRQEDVFIRSAYANHDDFQNLADRRTQIPFNQYQNPSVGTNQNVSSYSEFIKVLTKRYREFNATDSQNVLNFFSTFENLASVFNVFPHEKLLALQIILGGVALRTYQSLPSHIKNNYQLVKEKFLASFTDLSRPDKARRAYEERKQKSHENVETFFLDLWDLGKLAWPQKSNEELCDDMNYRFVYGLTNDIQEKIQILGMPPTLEDARERALNAEIAIQLKQKNSTPILVNVAERGPNPNYKAFYHSRGGGNKPSVSPEQLEIEKLSAELDRVKIEMSRLKNEESQNYPFYPNEPGHGKQFHTNKFQHYNSQNTFTPRNRNLPATPRFFNKNNSFGFQNKKYPEQTYEPEFNQYHPSQNQPSSPFASNPSRYRTTFDTTTWCDEHKLAGHSTKDCRLRKSRMNNESRNNAHEANQNNSPNPFSSRSHNPASRPNHSEHHIRGNNSLRSNVIEQQPISRYFYSDQKARAELETQQTDNKTITNVIDFLELNEGKPRLLMLKLNVSNLEKQNSNETKNGENPSTLQQNSVQQINDRILSRKMKPEEIAAYDYPNLAPLKLAVIVGNHVVFALCDTGAQCTIVSARFVNEIFAIKYDLDKPVSNLIAANDGPLSTYGIVQFPITIGKEIFQIKANVAGNMSEDFILGIDFLGHKMNRGSINVTKRYCKLRSVRYPLQTDTSKIPEEYLQPGTTDIIRTSFNNSTTSLNSSIAVVRTAQKVTIPPNSQIIVPATVSLKAEMQTELFSLEPVSKIADSLDVSSPRSLFDSSSPIISVCVMNNKNEPIVLPSRTFIGTAEPVFELYERKKSEAVAVNRVENNTKWEATLKNLCPESLEAKLKNRLCDLLTKHRQVFALEEEPLGVTHLVQHKIPTSNYRPVAKKPLRAPHSHRDVIKEEIGKMLKDNVIVPSNSAWSSPFFLIKKKDGSFRPVVDYRGVNALTHTDIYPIPRMDDYLDAFANAKFFTILDLKSGYWQIGMHPEDQPKTAFTCTEGHFEFTVMPFGLKNAPSDFQRLMEIVLSGLNWKVCLVYIDDIVVFSETFETHLENLDQVLKALKQANLKLKPVKCNFLQKEITFLGHVISREGIKPDQSKIEAINAIKTPSNCKQVQKFLGLVQWFRRFIPNLAEKARPLYELLNKKTKFEMTENRVEAFINLKKCITTPPILGFPVFNGSAKFILECDASAVAIGSVLIQASSSKEWVIAYASHQLLPAEQRYSAIERECLAIVWSLKHFKHYLVDRKVLIRTDHKPLSWLKSSTFKNSRIQRWVVTLSDFDFEIEHVPGSQNNVADYLSRPQEGENQVQVVTRSMSKRNLIDSQPDENTESTEMIVPKTKPNNHLSDIILSKPEFQQALNPLNLLQEQERDPFINDIRKMLQNATKATKQQSAYLLENDLVKRCWFNKGSKRMIIQLVVPKSIIKHVLHQFHGATISGHFGTEKVIGTILLRFWWPTIASDVNDWIKSCPACQMTKAEKTPKVPMISIPVSGPWEMLAVDCLQIKPSNSGNTNVVVFCDYFTKWVEAFPVSDIRAETIVDLFINNIVLRHGEPQYLLSDQGSNFTSKLVTDVCKLLELRKIQTTPYHPQCDGLVERFNKTLIEQLSRLAINEPNNWEKFLPYALFAYRSTPHDSTNPFFLMHGRQPTFGIDNQIATKMTHSLDYDSYRYFLSSTMLETQKIILQNIKIAQEKQKRYYDKKTKEKCFKQGDLVGVQTSPKFKLDKKYVGPFKVFTEPQNNTIELVDLTDLNRQIKVSLSRVKFWYDSDLRH